MSEEATGADGVGEAVPALVVRVLPSHEDVLVAHVVGSLVDDPGAALHPDGVAAADVGAELGAVAAAFVVVALEVPVLVEEDLQEPSRARGQQAARDVWASARPAERHDGKC